MFVRETLGFFRGISQNALAFVAQREIHGGGNFLPDRSVSLDLLANGLDRRVRTQKAVGQGLIFTQKSQQQVFRLNVRRPELAGFIPRKKDNAPCFLRIAFEHIALLPRSPKQIG